MSQDDQARANRAANTPIVEPEQGPAPTEPAVSEQAAAEVDEPAKVSLGPLGQFFKRRAEFFEQEAMNYAILLERATTNGK